MGMMRLFLRDGDTLQRADVRPIRTIDDARQEAVAAAHRISERTGLPERDLARLVFEVRDCTNETVLVVPLTQARQERRSRSWWKQLWEGGW